MLAFWVRDGEFARCGSRTRLGALPAVCMRCQDYIAAPLHRQPGFAMLADREFQPFLLELI